MGISKCQAWGFANQMARIIADDDFQLSVDDTFSGWCFQILFICTPKIGEDSHFD